LAKTKVEEVLLSEEDAKSQDQKAKTAAGKYPMLETEQGFLFESAAIARYLAS
jgi:elongation factor 1-gamma